MNAMAQSRPRPDGRFHWNVRVSARLPSVLKRGQFLLGGSLLLARVVKLGIELREIAADLLDFDCDMGWSFDSLCRRLNPEDVQSFLLHFPQIFGRCYFLVQF